MSEWIVFFPCLEIHGIHRKNNRAWPIKIANDFKKKFDKTSDTIWIQSIDGKLVDSLKEIFFSEYKFLPFSTVLRSFEHQKSNFFFLNINDVNFRCKSEIVFENQLKCGNPPPVESIDSMGCGQSKKQIKPLIASSNYKIPKADMFSLRAGMRFALGREYAISRKAADAFSSLSGIEIKDIYSLDGNVLPDVKQMTITGLGSAVPVHGIGKSKKCAECGYVFFEEVDVFRSYPTPVNLDFQVLDHFSLQSFAFRGGYFPKLIVSRMVVETIERHSLKGATSASKFAKYLAVNF